MICVFGFLIFAVVHQFRLLYYVKFGNRKKVRSEEQRSDEKPYAQQILYDLLHSPLDDD